MAAVAGIGLATFLATPSLARSTTTASSATASAPLCGIYWGSIPKVDSSPLALGPVKDVRTGQHACYDRMVIDVHAPLAATGSTTSRALRRPATPTASTPARGESVHFRQQCGMPVPGTHHSTAVDNPDEATDVSAYRTFRQVRELIYGPLGLYGPEGVQFALGCVRISPIRVFTLDGPGLDSRLVIDVAHKLKFRSFEAVEHRIAESPNELNLDVPN